jgi:hypothetical protein
MLWVCSFIGYAQAGDPEENRASAQHWICTGVVQNRQVVSRPTRGWQCPNLSGRDSTLISLRADFKMFAHEEALRADPVVAP